MRRRSRSRRTAAAGVIIAGGAIAASALLLLRALRLRSAPRRSIAWTTRRDASPPSPVGTSIDVQSAVDGVGPLRHRRYEVDVVSHTHSSTAMLQAIQSHIAELSPTALAAFAKTVGSDMHMQQGDEYDITMLGPWNGRVRVADLTENAFTLVTCEGHPEAGHIVFHVLDHARNEHTMQIVIESWARSRNATVELAYGTIGVGQRVQTEVWVTFLQRVAELAGMTDVPEVRITTEEIVD